MKYLGIDYGTKKIGLALSDDSGTIAFPHAVIATADKEIEIEKLIQKEGVGEIVIGKSIDLKGRSNKVQEEINSFAAILGMQYGLPVHFVPEFFSSSEARHAAKNERGREKPVANPRRTGKGGGTAGRNASNVKTALERSNVDANAAAIILQRHLDAIQLKGK